MARPPAVYLITGPMAAGKVVAARDAARADKGYTGHWTVREHYEEFVATTPRLGLWLDTSEQAPEATVDEILRAVPPS